MNHEQALVAAAIYAENNCPKPRWNASEWQEKFSSWIDMLKDAPTGNYISSGGMMVAKTEEGFEFTRHVVSFYDDGDTYVWI